MSELARMNRVVTAGQLTASIAHEIRQPLSSISTFGNAGLNWLKREPPNLDGARSGPENIVQAVRRADDVIKSVTALFKNEPTTRTEVYVNALIQQILISTAQIRDAHVILLESNFVENPPPYVMADPGQLQQVVLNLISNAIEAMSASQRGARILRVDTNVEQANSVIITVADSGPGIDPEITEQLFKPFFTTKSSGMGLGLSICKTIIEERQGPRVLAGGRCCRRDRALRLHRARSLGCGTTRYAWVIRTNVRPSCESRAKGRPPDWSARNSKTPTHTGSRFEIGRWL